MPTVTLRVAMADRIELFERRNRLRIVALVVLATLDYIVAVVMAAIAVGIGIALAILFSGGDVFSDTDTFLFFAVGVAVVAVGSALIGILVGLFRIPFLRSGLEHTVLTETGAHVVTVDDEQTEVRDLLEGLALASGLPPPRVAVIDDAAPNSFGVGTRPSNTIVGVTTGLGERLSRDELEAVLAYEVSRIRSWDVALSSWTVALTSGAISAVDSEDDDLLKSVLGFLPRRLAESMQVWALRDQGIERDRVAVQFTRNPLALIRALEKLDADASTIRHVSRATAPLWLEFPAHALGSSSSRATRRLAHELLLDERIDLLRELAGQPSRPVTR